MNFLQKSHEVNKLNYSIPTLSKFSLIRNFLVWLTIIFSACWRLIVRTTRDKCSSNLLPTYSKERLENQNYQELALNKQNKFDTGIKKLVNTDMKHLFVVIASLGQLCANAGLGLVQRTLVKFKYLMGLVFLTTVILFHPPSNMYSYAGIGEESKLLNSGYNNNFSNQGFNGENAELFNFDNSAVENSLERMSIENTEIKIDTNSDSLSPSADMENPIQLAQATPEVTLIGTATSGSFTLANYETSRTISELPNNIAQTVNSEITFMVSIPDSTSNNFILNYSLSQGAGGNFLIFGSTETVTNNKVNRTLNLSSAQTSSFGGKKYFQGSFLLDNDHVHEDPSTITLTLETGSGYTLSSNKTATVTVNDNDPAPATLLTLVGAGGELAVDESKFSKPYTAFEPTTGQTTVYFLIHFPFTNSRSFDIKYRVTQRQSESFIVGTTTADRTLNPSVRNTMSHGNQGSTDMTKIYTIGSFKIQSDSAVKNGEITLTLKTGTGYSLPAVGERSITINVIDNTTRVVSISASKTTVSENESITYTLTASPAPTLTDKITVSLLIGSDGGANLAPGFKTSIEMSSATKMETLSLENDDVFGASGRVTIQIVDGMGYQGVSSGVPNVSPTRVAQITVTDDDPPTFNIAESEITKTVTEPFGVGNPAANAMFSFTNPNGLSITDKAFTISRDGTSTASASDFGSLPTNPMLSSTNLTLTIPIIGDDLDEDNEKLILNLTFASSVNAQFKVGTLAATKSIKVTINITDADSEPQLNSNYEGDALSVAKGIGTFELEYHFSTSGVSGRNITIGYTVNSANTDLENTDYSINGNLTATSGSVTLFAGQSKVALPITIISDNITQASENLALNLTFTNAVYTFARVTTQSLVISVVDKPNVAIETIYTRVHKDDYFEFTVSAIPAPTQNQTITVGFEHQGFSDVRTKFPSDTIPNAVLTANEPQKTIRVEFLDTGNFHIKLGSGSDYVVNFLNNSVGAFITGLNLPAVSLGTAPTVANTDLKFDISVQHGATRTEDLPIRFRISETGSQTGYLKNRMSGDIEPFDIPAAGSKNLTIDLDRSFTATAGGDIFIELLPGVGYKLGTNATRVISIPGHDNPIFTKPKISITSIAAGATGTGVTEGYSFGFVVHSDSRVRTDLDVTVNVAEATPGTGTLLPTLQGGGTTVTIPSGMQEVSGSVIMASGANVPIAGGAINVSIGTNGLYDILNNTQSISVTVKDSNTGSATTPVVSLSGPAAVVEANTAMYMVTASHTPSSAPLDVAVKIENLTGDFLATGQANEDTASITTHTTPGTIMVRTKADNPDGNTGIIKVTLVEKAGYALPATASSFGVNTRVVDAVISITSDQNTGVARGGDLFFTITLDPPPSSPQSFDISARDNNGTGSNHMVFPSTIEVGTNGMAEGRVRVNTSGTGNIVVNIDESSYPDYSINSLSLQLLTAVTLPEISIAKDTEFIVEGDVAEFTLTASASPTEDIDVDVIFNVDDDFIATNESCKFKTVPFTSAGSTTAPVIFATKVNASSSTSEGSISARLVPGAGYSLATTVSAQTASIVIQKSDSLPKVTIALAGTATAFDEGESITFVLTATVVTPPVNSFIAYVQLADDATYDFLAPETTNNSHPVMLASGGTEELKISTVADATDEGTGGMITATIQPDPLQANQGQRATYLPNSSNNSITANITDNDDPSLPEVTIVEGSSTPITEGESATFTLTATGTLNASLVVSVRYTQVGAFIARDLSSNSTQTYTIPNTGPTANTFSFSQATIDDGNQEENGAIIAQVISDPASTDTYAVGMLFSAMVVVEDNDQGLLPSITITLKNLNTTQITEDTNAEFTVNAANPPAAAPPTTAIEVMVQITQDGSFLVDATNTLKTVSVMSGASVDLTIMISDDTYDEDDGSVTAEIVAEEVGDSPATYALGTNVTSTINVTDNDDPPIISIQAVPLVAEGSDPNNNVTMEFNVKLLDANGNETKSGKEVKVNYLTSPGTARASINLDTNPADFAQKLGELTFAPVTSVVDSGDSSKPIQIEIYGDSEAEADETFTVTLSTPTNAVLSATPSAEGIITDDDYSVLSIAAAELTEGADGETERMIFTVTANPAPTTQFMVTWRTSVEVGDTATADTDYTDATGTIIIRANEISNSFTVDILGDDTSEPDETFTVTISNHPSNGLNSRVSNTSGSVKGTIIDDDFDETIPRVSISLADENDKIIDEGDSFAVSISTGDIAPSATNPIDVAINVDQENGDYIAFRIPRFVRLTNTESEKTINIHTVDDSNMDGEGKIIVSISGAGEEFSIGRASVEVNVRDDNDAGSTQDTRIAVADLAVDAILDTLGVSTAASETSNTPFLLPNVSVVAVATKIDEGATAKFLITSKNGVESSKISVSFQIHHAHVQIVLPRNMEVQLGGQDQVAIAIPTINDNYANNEDGYVAVTLTENPSYLITESAGSATVNISDKVDRQQRQAEITAHAQAFLPDLNGRMGAGALETISNRIELGFSKSSNQMLALGGQNSITGLLTASGETINENSTTLKSFLGDSSFAMTLNSGDEFAIPTTLWGLGDYQNLSPTGRNHTIDWSGDLFTGYLGIDSLINDSLLTGISALVSESEVDFSNSASNAIQFDVRTTSFNPYLGWTSHNRNSELYATIGLGQGEISIKQESYDDTTLDSESYSIGLNGNQVLFTSNNIENGATKLSIKGDSWFAHQFIAGRDGILADFHTNAQHLRIRTEGSHQFDFASGSTFSPLISIGIRNDVKDDQSVLGVELTSSADYNNPVGLTIAGIGNMLVSQANQVQKVTINSSLSYDRGTDNRGIIVEVSPTWGYIDANIQDTLWSNNILDTNFETGQYSNGASLTSEFGYGFDILQGDSTLTPISGFAISTNQDYEYQLGTRLNLGSNAQFDLTGSRNHSIDSNDSTTVSLEGTINW